MILFVACWKQVWLSINLDTRMRFDYKFRKKFFTIMLFNLLILTLDRSQLRNKMTKVQYKGREMGNDLHLIDTMRCRDSGTAPFVKYFERVYKSKKMTSWRDLQPYFNELEFKLLRKLYNGVEDIDLLTGLLLERHRKNEVGPIGGAIIANQFYRLKYGDRFFYSNPNNPYTFEPGMEYQQTNMLVCQHGIFILFLFVCRSIATNQGLYFCQTAVLRNWCHQSATKCIRFAIQK